MPPEMPVTPHMTNDASNAATLPFIHPIPRVVVFGIRCAFTSVAVAAMRDEGIGVVALLLPGPPKIQKPIPTPQTRRAVPMMSQHGSSPQPRNDEPATWSIGEPRDSSTIELVAGYAPDVIVVACYPKLIPSQTRNVATYGAINIHPSLLPEGRGPDPLFWTLRRGDGVAGVTVHLLSDAYDAGPVLSTRTVLYPDGTSEARLEECLARTGGTIAATSIRALMSGTAVAVEQDESMATYQRWPNANDFILEPGMNVRHAFNFGRGVLHRPEPLIYQADLWSVEIVEILDVVHNDDCLPSAKPSDATTLPFRDGLLVARVKSVPN